MQEPKRIQKVYITTEDTKKTYEYPADKGQSNPPLWEVELRISVVDTQGHASPINKYTSSSGTIFVERQTLVDRKMLPYICGVDKKPPEDNTPTAGDLIIQLLESVGFYPNEAERGEA